MSGHERPLNGADSEPLSPDVERAIHGPDWPAGVTDGLSLACSDCGERPLFDYQVSDDFWRQWIPDDMRLGVVCLSCLNRRCGGEGLAAAIEQVQWTGTGHTVVLRPTARYEYEEARP